MRYQQPQQPPMQPMPQPVPQPMPPAQPQGAPQQTLEQPVAPMTVDCPVPLDAGFRRVAGLYFKDTWQMLLGLIGLLVIIFVAVRLATHGYLWGLVFVLLAALAAEAPALVHLPLSIADKLGGTMTARTIVLKGVERQSPSLLSRMNLSAKDRYALTDTQDRRYLFTADKGLQQTFSDMEGMEVEIAFLPKSGMITGIHPVRRSEYLSVFESARERHMRQVFKDYLP